MSILLSLSKVGRVMVLMTLSFWPCLSQAADPKPDETFDFGRGALGADVSHEFHLVNSGTSQLTITEVKTSCPCTRIVAFPKNIAPGQIGIITIDTKLDRAGSKEVLVTAMTDGKVPSHIFAVKGEIIAAANDPKLFVEPKALISQPKAEDSYIDVRSNVAFGEARIPASMNLPLFELPARTYLKSRNLIIVGTGMDDTALVGTANTCRKEGFSSIRIMRGGIRQWQQAGGRLEGIFFGHPALDEISASQVYSSIIHSPWLVLVPKAADYEGKVSISIQVISYDDVKSVEGIAKAALANNDGITGIVVFAASDQNRATLTRLLPALDRPLFVVTEEWRTFATLAMADAQSSEQEPVTKSVTSGPLTHRIIGCSSCP